MTMKAEQCRMSNGSIGSLGNKVRKFCAAQSNPSSSYMHTNFDRRIIRGTLFATIPEHINCKQFRAYKKIGNLNRQSITKRFQLQKEFTLSQIDTPPLPGKIHELVQTELFLQELVEEPNENGVAVQTDYFLDRPMTPFYCPIAAGQDESTQIEPGDLYDYDTEVKPLLEVLVNKSISQALLEVLEEEEIAALREQQRRFLEIRQIEKSEQERLEEQERRFREEKHKRLNEEEEVIQSELETEERVVAAVLLTGYIAELLPTVLEKLKVSGFLLNEIKTDVAEQFMPWLLREVEEEMGTMIESKQILEGILKEAILIKAQNYTQKKKIMSQEN